MVTLPSIKQNAVAEDQVHVVGEFFLIFIAVETEFGPYCPEVHWLLDDDRVSRNVESNRINRVYENGAFSN